MNARDYSPADRLLAELQHTLQTLADTPRAVRPAPAADAGAGLSPDARRLAARLMRVNHSGEVAAQALYRGQASVTQSGALRTELLDAATEENDHLAWCAERTRALGGRTSLLAPVWYAGSFAIGAAAGLLGDRVSLGFLAETETQVAAHLDTHLDSLPTDDSTSRAIVTAMREDELKHRQRARDLGGATLPAPVRHGMRLLARVMTTSSFRL